ncbi:MAG: glycosyltransferase [Candidatus Cloacimonetes bacterium]|nr:glycosyltransferase [Pelagibacterales bacterium]MBL7108037.1 glycosyltransferase [Candidatus Cloacimonadota bacterium]
MRNIFLYTPWCEQGLSYDAKVIEKICLNNNITPFITYRNKRKINWDCNFISIRKIHKIISTNDIFFCFERFPKRHLKKILNKINHSYLMINYEYYLSEENSYHKLFTKIFCKSKIAFHGCKNDGLQNLIYLPWILWNFPILQPNKCNKIVNVLFNGGTGGLNDRRNFESIIYLIKNYTGNDVIFTLKFTSKIRRWTKKILKKNMNLIKLDDRIILICENYDRNQYQKLLNENDINLAPSKFEGFGLTLLEALHSRIPTITINNSPMNEIITNGENGICVSANEVGKIQKQPIYEINKKEFIFEFSKLIKNPDRINEMKSNTALYIEKNRGHFINTIIKTFNSKH